MHKLVLGLSGLVAIATLSESQRASDTPPLRLFLEHPGGRIEVQLDQPFELDVGGQQVSLTLRAHPTRVLDIGPLSFEFPKDATFESDDSDPVRFWSVELPDALMMLQRYSIPGLSGRAALDSLLEQVQERFPDGELIENDVVLRLGGSEVSGHRHRVRLGGTELEQEYYLLQPTTGDAIVLMLQDSLTEDGGPTDDFVNLRGLIERTLQRKAE